MYRFSYAPKRDYPYKWLTPLVAAGGLVAIAIVLFVNIITQSYELVAIPTTDIKTQAACSIEVGTLNTPNQKTYFNLEGTYNLIDDNNPHFLKNTTSSPSLFWGQSLLSLYYLVASHAYFNASRGSSWGDSANAYSAYINLKRQSTASVGGPDEVLSDDFFDIYCITEDNVCKLTTIPLLSQGSGTGVGVSGSPYPTIWPAINILGRAMWFTVMTDLGQKNITVPNMLADPNLLANLTSNVTNEANAWLELQNSGVSHGTTTKLDTNLAIHSFDPSVIPAPALGVNISYFSTSYICQMPMLKPAGTRFIAILSSSLILLHTIWNIFWLVFNWIVLDRLQEEANNVVEAHIVGDMSSGGLEEKADNSWEAGQKANNYTQVNQAERHLD